MTRAKNSAKNPSALGRIVQAIQSVCRWIHGCYLELFHSDKRYSKGRQVDTRIASLEKRLAHLEMRASQEDAEFATAASEVRGHLELATKARKDGLNSAVAWWHLGAAHRALVAIMTDNELALFLTALDQECKEKLVGWRQNAARDLLETARSETADRAIKCDVAAAVALIRDEKADKIHRNTGAKRDRISILFFPLLLGLIVFFLGVSFGLPLECNTVTKACISNSFATVTETRSSAFWFLVICFGLALIGASISAITGLANSERVPEEFDTRLVLFSRTLVGGASGPLAFFIADTGLINIVSTPSQALILAFALGFSEKLLVGVMDKVAAPKKPT